MLKIKSLVWINGLFLIVLWMFLFFLPEEVFRIVVIVLGVETLLSGGIWAVISWNQKDYQYRGLLFFWALFEVVFWLLLMIFWMDCESFGYYPRSFNFYKGDFYYFWWA